MNQNEPLLNPRVIIVQKLYGHHLNNDSEITFPKHRYKKFIKDVVNGTIERDDVINNEISSHLNSDLISSTFASIHRNKATSHH